MVSRLWLFALILTVPVIGFAASAGANAKMASDLRTAARVQVPDASPEQIAALTVANLCEPESDESQDFCDTNAQVLLLGRGSLIAAEVGVALVALLWLAGLVARTNRRLLLLFFRPGLYLTSAVLIVLVLMHAAIGIGTIYYAEAVLTGRIHGGIMLAIGIGAVYGAIAIAKHAFGVVQRATTGAIGISINETDSPRLWERVRDAADRLSALMPDHIVVGLTPNFYVTEAEVNCLSGTCRGRTLYCSLPLARILTVEEFTGIVGHELGHSRALTQSLVKDSFRFTAAQPTRFKHCKRLEKVPVSWHYYLPSLSSVTSSSASL